MLVSLFLPLAFLYSPFHIKERIGLSMDTNDLKTPTVEESDFGKCHQFNTPRTFLKINEKTDSDFKFSVEKKINDESSLKYINHNSLLDTYHQLYVSDIMFSQVLGLKKPLSTQRYYLAKFINITIEESNKIYGVAYDEVTTNKELGLSNCFISMKLSSQINPVHNFTPAHELFHLYQNSVMMFKHAWLTEGLAQWSGSIFEEGTGEEEELPDNKKKLLEVMSSSYDASKFWTRLFKLVDQNNEFSVPNYLDTITYLNNEAVLKDNKAYGVTFIKVLFDELSKESDHVSEIKGWNRYGWKEKDQKDPALNPYIWNAVKRAVAKSIPYEQQSEELRRCMEIEL